MASLWSRIPYAYKFVALSLMVVFVAIIYNWGSLMGLWGVKITDTNLFDQFGPTCTFVPGPSRDFAGIEDMTEINGQVFYVASPHRRLISSKDNMIEHFGQQEFTTPKDYFTYLTDEQRSPKIFFTNLSSSSFPEVDIQPVEVLGFDLSIYYDFFPLGVDSHYNNTTNTMFLSIVFVNRFGQNVGIFQVLPSEPVPQLQLIRVVQHNLFTSLNGIVMKNEREFFVTNFLSVNPLDEEKAAFFEILLIKRKGSALHCATSPEYLPDLPETLQSKGNMIVDSTIAEITPNTLSNYPNQSPLYCYPVLTNLGQPNGITIDKKHGILYVSSSLNQVIFSFELPNNRTGPIALLQNIPIPVGTDNLKVDPDTSDLYVGNNPSSVMVAKALGNELFYSPSVVYVLRSKMIGYSKSRLEKKMSQEPENDIVPTNNQQINMDDPNYIDNSVNTYKNTENDDDWKEFWYLDPNYIPLYADMAPNLKGGSPTALPIPAAYTNGKLADIGNFRIFITGSIYDAGIDVCRSIV